MSSPPDNGNPMRATRSPDPNDRSPLRHPTVDTKEHIYIAVAVIVPVVVTCLLCILTYCLYRCKKKRRAQRNMLRSSTIPADRQNPKVSTISHNPFVKEEIPAAYDINSETNKERPLRPIYNNTIEQFPVPPPQNDTIPSSTNKNKPSNIYA